MRHKCLEMEAENRTLLAKLETANRYTHHSVADLKGVPLSRTFSAALVRIQGGSAEHKEPPWIHH